MIISKDLQIQAFDAIYFGIVVVLMLVVLYKGVYKKLLKGKKNIDLKKVPGYIAFLFVLLVIMDLTLFRGPAWKRVPRWELFSSYRLAFSQNNYEEWTNLFLNICMLVPYGFILPIAFDKMRKAWRTYLAGFGLSLTIEVIQYTLKCGMFEADDLFNNLLGAVIGYGLFALGRAIVTRKFSKKILVMQVPLLVVAVVFSWVFLK